MRAKDARTLSAVRLIVGMALSVTVHSDWLFAGHEPPSPSQLVDQLTRLTVWGLRGRPL